MRPEDAKGTNHSEADVLRLGRARPDDLAHRRTRNSAGRQEDLVTLLTAVAESDHQSFAGLYRKTRPSLFAIALNVTGNPATAEEVLQEAFLTIWRKAHRYEQKAGSPIAWLGALVRNKAIDRLRAQERRHEASTVTLDDVEYALGTECGQDEGRILDGQTVRQALCKLRDVHRHYILLVYFQGMSHAEVAQATNTPIGTVKSRVRKGIAELRASMTA